MLILSSEFSCNDTGGTMNNMQNIYDLSGSSQMVRHRVLRNTYWLLALSMIPTVIGAVVGLQLHLALTGGIGFILFLAIAFGFIWAIEKNKESGAGVALLLGFTFFMGVMLTPLLSRTLGYSNGGFLIMAAFGGTASVFAVLASIATVSKRDFSALSKWLFAGLVIIILASIANISAYILYDVQQIVNGGETNYISATLRLYLDVYNIFTSLLSLLGFAGGSRD